MSTTSKHLKKEVEDLKKEMLPEKTLEKKKHALKTFTHWLKKKSVLQDKDYRKSIEEIEKIKKVLPTETEIPHANAVGGNDLRLSRAIYGFFIILSLLILLGGTGYYIYTNKKTTQSNSTPLSNLNTGRVLNYRGKLTRPDGSAIDVKTDVIFKLYYSQAGGAPIYSGACIGENGIVPDVRGSFSIVLGASCNMPKIPDKVFSTGSDIYLGVTIGEGKELSPRQLISKVSYALNADKIKGMSLGGDLSNIPYIDEHGQMLIHAASPIIKSTSGNFSLEGQTITFKTSEGTNGSIIFTPDFGGNTIIGTGNLGIGDNLPTAKLDVRGDASISGVLSLTAPDNYITTLNGSSLHLATSVSGNDGLVARLTLQNNGNIGFGTTTPHYLLSVIKKEEANSIASFINLSSTDKIDTNVLKLGLGVPQTSSASSFIQFFSDVTADTNGRNVGSIGLENGNVQYKTSGADFAEYFDTKELLVDGTIVSVGKTGIVNAIDDTIPVGVISNSAGFVGNSNERNTQKALVGLLGQIDTWVSTLNGEIEVGDIVSVSAIPGYGVKKGEGMKVGIALEGGLNIDERLKNENCPVGYRYLKDQQNRTIRCGKIKVFVRP